jgi:hypothetical protein
VTRPAWDVNSRATELVRRAGRLDVGPAPGARARVWQKLELRRLRERERPARLRLGWTMFGAGAACAAAIAAILVLVAPRARSTEMTIAATTEATTLDLGGDGRIVAAPATRARLLRTDGNVTLAVDKGALLVHVLPRKQQQAPFVIKTAAFSARVVGTVLRVVAHDDGGASIAVGHGAVEVTPRGAAPLTLRAGERWPADSSDAPATDELLRMGAGHLEGADAAALSPVAPATAPAPALDPAARCARLHGERAVACWLELADTPAGDPARAESALYQAGFLRMHELGDAAFALGIWERQRQRFPHGLLHDEAHTSIIDALVALGRSRAAAGEIADYLRVQPHGLRSAEMHFVRATLWLAEDHGSCRRAARELDEALTHPAAPWAERARAARAACR